LRHPADHGLEYGSPQAAHVPGRRDHVNFSKAAPNGLEDLLERQRREVASVLLAIEPLLLEDHNWEALLEQGDPSVMRFTYDAKDLHRLSDSLRNSSRLAELSASVFPAWLGYHLGAKSAVCNGSVSRATRVDTALRN
jgi:hypothetical protein